MDNIYRDISVSTVTNPWTKRPAFDSMQMYGVLSSHRVQTSSRVYPVSYQIDTV